MKYHMKFFITALPKKPRQFSKFGSIAEIPIADFSFYRLNVGERKRNPHHHMIDQARKKKSRVCVTMISYSCV
jgi:hypothetical protein